MNRKIAIFDKFVFWFIILDNLFFPYFWLKCVSYSFPFIFLWRFYKQNSSLSYNRIIRVISLLGGISTMLGVVIYPDYAFDNLVIYLNLLSAMFSLQLFTYVRENSDQRLMNKIHIVLSLFIVAAFTFTIIFFIDFSLYESVRNIFNNRIGESSVDILSSTIRFGYYWSDENNIGYMSCAVLLFVSMGKYLSLFQKSILAMMTSVIVIATMSTGALVVLGISLFIFVYFQILSDNSVKIGTKLLVLFAIGIILFYGLSILFSSDVYQAFSLRLETKTDGYEDNRSDIYSYTINTVEWWQYFLWGYGGRTIIEGVYKSTHNGVMTMILSYGMIVTWKYCKLYFCRKKDQVIKDYLWRIPVLIGFMINIMITEDKIHVLMMLLLAFETYPQYLTNKKYIK